LYQRILKKGNAKYFFFFFFFLNLRFKPNSLYLITTQIPSQLVDTHYSTNSSMLGEEYSEY
jgi:hypothetical protein